MNRYKLPIKYRHPNGIRNALYALLCILAACLLWHATVEGGKAWRLYSDARYLVDSYRAETEELRNDQHKLLAMLNGRPHWGEDEEDAHVVEVLTIRLMPPL
jgi:hypothetical protein